MKDKAQTRTRFDILTSWLTPSDLAKRLPAETIRHLSQIVREACRKQA